MLERGSMADDKKRYNFMENVLNEINGGFISLSSDDVSRSKLFITNFIDDFIKKKMTSKDSLFGSMFQRVFHGGSFYDGLRIGKPDEFDLDLLLNIPKIAEPNLVGSNIPGFVFLQLKNLEGFMKRPEAQQYKKFDSLFDEKGYLHSIKVLSWMEGVVNKTLNNYPREGNKYLVKINNSTFRVSLHKGGPALTLKFSSDTTYPIDIDLVPSFVFTAEKWPKNGFQSNPVPSKSEFFIVPKKPNAPENQPIPRYWRLSFQEQERVLIDNKRYLKPTIKLLKKLRDTLGHIVISSYYIKTIVIFINDQNGSDFWNSSLSYAFMTSLKMYRDFINDGKIPYYWNRKNNLIKRVNNKTLENNCNKLKIIINDIERNSSEPRTIAKYLLNSEEYRNYMDGNYKLVS